MFAEATLSLLFGYFEDDSGRSGRVMVLCNIQCWGALLIWIIHVVGQRPILLDVDTGVFVLSVIFLCLT